MEAVLLVVLLLITLAMIVVILLQRSEGGALGMGGGGGGGAGGGMFTARGTANLLTRTTAFLGAGFMLTCLALAVLASQTREPTSILEQAPVTAPAEPQTDEPTVPVSE
ncbi:preprotein translocase subunit SecG [Aestuariispira insulae]|uniref:Protein-export membrane protein SecG n=1 Tax=Aestuariispira insulae TaxID=1461337 RepID=A0A3D9HUT5_9PROT|nr:preprotein translocase subunit SecG [Aestuariispira insulae]RED53273.1 protein translocase subunit secG [Aestuariispira insulae]